MAKIPAAVIGVGQTHHRAKREDVSIAGLLREAVEYLPGTLLEHARPRALENHEGSRGLPACQIPATSGMSAGRAGLMRISSAVVTGTKIDSSGGPPHPDE